MPVFEQSSELPVSADEAFAWHCRPGAFQRLAPPWETIELISSEGVAEGSQATIRMKLGPIPKMWIAEHHGIIPGRQFQDIQLAGPFAKWEHTHRMEPVSAGACRLSDRIEHQLPLGILGEIFGGRLIGQQLERTFRYRHALTASDLKFHAAYSREPAMKIAVGGSTGLVGSALIPFLTTGGHEVARLTRGGKSVDDGTTSIDWDPSQGRIDAAGIEGCDAVVHLGGHNIAHGRWTTGMKRLIRDSRVNSTSLLCRTLAGLANPPRVLVCASAIGFYGDRGQDVMTENSEPGPSFLSKTCVEWEQATAPARDAGVRVVNLRIGVVLSPQGGALQKMLLPFKLGGGGIVGNGKQWWSWVSIEDLPRIILHGIQTESLSGPVNATSPGAVDNREFTKTLGRVLRRPTLIPMPAFVVKLAFGEMGEELLLGSTRVVPERLIDSGYEYAFPELEPALRHLLGR
ncbi:MAG: TIGR01777 family oxidoreductase [Planctomycetota bacterium]|nr:TIGR01777 family oxidoreductase [Planctomycetota bacterium]